MNHEEHTRRIKRKFHRHIVKNRSHLYSCTLCGKQRREKNSLKNHIAQKHLSDKYKIFKCNKCGIKFARKHMLKKHERIHAKIFQCKICKQCFDRPRRLNNHITISHSDSQHTTSSNNNINNSKTNQQNTWRCQFEF